jgi:phenylacetate-CoA ligase
VAAALAEEQLQGRLRIAPGLVATSSEVLAADMRRRIGQAFGVEPLDFYGTTEAAVVAASRQGQAGMDVLEDLVLVEVTLAGGPNPLGLPSARIAAVDGRSDDVITLPGAGGRPVAVHPFRLRAPFSELLEVRQYQVVHDPAGLHVAVVLREEAPADTLARVRSALTAELRDAGAVPPPIAVTPVPRIDRDPGHGAKSKLVRSQPAPTP